MKARKFLSGIVASAVALCFIATLLLPAQVYAENSGSSTTLTITIPETHSVQLTIGANGVVHINGTEYSGNQTIAIDRLATQEYLIKANEGWQIRSVMYGGVEQIANNARTMRTYTQGDQANTGTDRTQFTFTAPAINADGLALAVTFEEVEVTTTKLQEEVDKITAEDLNKSDYTEDSWQALQDAQKKAEEVLNNPAATQAEIDEALRNLSEARANLKKATDQDPTGQDPTDPKPTGTGGTGTKGQTPPSTTNRKGSGVNTGDTSNLLLYGVLLVLASGTIVVLKRKHKKV